MDSDWLLIGIVIAALVYFSGYRALGTIIGLLVLFVFAASVVFERPKKASAGSQVLEPIVIESTRGAPYKIADEMELWYEPDEKPGREKTFSKIGKGMGQILKKIRD